MQPFATQRHGNHSTDSVTCHTPVAQRGILQIIKMHPDTCKHIDKHGTGIDNHQQQIEQSSHTDCTQFERVQ